MLLEGAMGIFVMFFNLRQKLSLGNFRKRWLS